MKHLKKLFALVLTLCLLASLAPAVLAVGDDIEGNPEQEALQAFIDLGYLKGYPDGTIRPDATITRAEFAALVNRVTGFHLKSSKIADFTDVKETSWYLMTTDDVSHTTPQTDEDITEVTFLSEYDLEWFLKNTYRSIADTLGEELKNLENYQLYN